MESIIFDLFLLDLPAPFAICEIGRKSRPNRRAIFDFFFNVRNLSSRSLEMHTVNTVSISSMIIKQGQHQTGINVKVILRPESVSNAFDFIFLILTSVQTNMF